MTYLMLFLIKLPCSKEFASIPKLEKMHFRVASLVTRSYTFVAACKYVSHIEPIMYSLKFIMRREDKKCYIARVKVIRESYRAGVPYIC